MYLDDSLVTNITPACAQTYWRYCASDAYSTPGSDQGAAGPSWWPRHNFPPAPTAQAGAVFSQPTWIFPKAFQAEVMRKKTLCSQLMKLLGYEVRSMLFLSHRGAGSGRRAELGVSSGRPRDVGLGRECTLVTWKPPVTDLPKARAPLSFSDGSVSSSL